MPAGLLGGDMGHEFTRLYGEFAELNANRKKVPHAVQNWRILTGAARDRPALHENSIISLPFIFEAALFVTLHPQQAQAKKG